jgi:hypothetical protein
MYQARLPVLCPVTARTAPVISRHRQSEGTMEMAEGAAPIRSESARRYVDGRRGGWGVVTLYPDRLASVEVRAELWGCFFGPVVMVFAGWPVTEDAGAFHAIIGVLVGSTIGRFIDRRRAARKIAAGGADVTIIPLDAIGGLRTDRSTRLGGQFAVETLVVTTADGTEHGFCGRIGSLSAEIAGTLTGLGREVRATPLGLAVTPQAAPNGA